MAAWAKPIVLDQVVNGDDLFLGEDVSDIIMMMVYRDKDLNDPARSDFEGFCEELAGGYYPENTSLTDIEVDLPSYLGNSLGYWSAEDGGSSFLICSLHEGAIYVFVLFSVDREAEPTQRLLTRIVGDALRSGPPYQSTQIMEIMADGFAGERPLTDLPGRDELPPEFQLLDEEYFVVLP